MFPVLPLSFKHPARKNNVELDRESAARTYFRIRGATRKLPSFPVGGFTGTTRKVGQVASHPSNFRTLGDGAQLDTSDKSENQTVGSHPSNFCVPRVGEGVSRKADIPSYIPLINSQKHLSFRLDKMQFSLKN